MAERGEETGLEGMAFFLGVGWNSAHIRKPGAGIHLHASRVPIL